MVVLFFIDFDSILEFKNIYIQKKFWKVVLFDSNWYSKALISQIWMYVRCFFFLWTIYHFVLRFQSTYFGFFLLCMLSLIYNFIIESKIFIVYSMASHSSFMSVLAMIDILFNMINRSVVKTKVAFR